MENPQEVITPEESARPSIASILNIPKPPVKKEPIKFKIPTNVRALNKQRLRELIDDLDPNQKVDDDVEEVLLETADVFLKHVLTYSCEIAEKRNAELLETKDVRLILENYWNMYIPGFDSDELGTLEDVNNRIPKPKEKKRKVSKETVCEE